MADLPQVAIDAANMFGATVDAQYPAMQEQRAAMLSGVNLNLGITPSGEQFSGAPVVAGIAQDRTNGIV